MNIKTQFTFSKHERLKSRRLIEHLFNKGKVVSSYPFKVLYEVVDEAAETVLAGVTVSKKKFKKAVDRNRVKRIMRESYRMQKLCVPDKLRQKNRSVVLFIIYTGKDLPVFAEVNEKLRIVLGKIENDIIKIDFD